MFFTSSADELAQAIRMVDGSHSLGAAALADALIELGTVREIQLDRFAAQVKAEVLEDFADRIYPGPTADTIIAALRAKALEYRQEANR